MKNFFFFMNFKTVCLIVIYLILTGTAKSNWINPEKKNLSAADRSVSSNPEKKDSLPEGVTEEWLNRLTDEKGNRILPAVPLGRSETNTGRSGNIPEDPEGDALQRKKFTLGLNDAFGYSVSSAGDVNGDGYSDIIIGAYGFSSFTYTGRSYIYFGGLNMNTVADVTFTGENINNNFGQSVSSAGDVNGDGYSDVIVGANGYSTNTGRAYIYFGGTSMNNTADVIMTGEAITNFFGNSVSSAGDINSDGYSDVIVGAYGNSSFTGRAYIFLGGTSMNNTSDVTMTGFNNNFGHSVSAAGDVNGDGYSDVIVGTNIGGIGEAYIFFGGLNMNIVADMTMTGEETNDNFGYSVSSAGDVNGDGYSDVIVGAFRYSSFTGRAYIYLGGASMNNTADVTMTGEGINNNFGYSVSSAGDVNGDGYSDVIVGAYFANKAYIYFGGALMTNTADVTMTEQFSGSLGYSVSSAGDVNGDGYSDVIVGANGEAYLFDYVMRNEITQDVTMTGETTSNRFGRSVSSAGDVNGDGYSDVIVGAFVYSLNTGRAYIYFGGASMDNIADVTITGDTIGDKFGISVSSAGDVNGDGYSDVIVGAEGHSSQTGRAYIFFGGASMNFTADVIMTGETINNVFGGSVSSAGDVNGDGYSDVIVGADGYSSSTGRAYIYLGGASMNNTADVIMTGESNFNFFGGSVSSAGDVNGDGYSDVIVGAGAFNAFRGRTYIYFGGAFMNNSADVTMTGENANDFLGRVSSAGDVNGDGYSDVIVGAHGHSSNTGRAYIYIGGASMDNIADVTMTGESAGDLFGNSVSSAGDINGDGFSDLIVGANGHSTNTGKAYIYFGGLSMDNTADVTMNGEATSNDFGLSASSAGDVNGDGYSDVFSGASEYSSSTGRAYIYLGSQINIKPNLLFVKDIPNDQGGKVNLKWARSGFDVNGNNSITDYYVEMSNPPIGGNYAWIPAGTVAATKNSFYGYNVITPYDSSSNSTGTFYFRVTARTSEPSQYWRSNILSGRSLDNIAPLLVSPFTAISESINVRTNWERSAAPDLLNYVLFRSTSPSIDPYTETPLSTLTDSTYLDTAPLTGLYYYFIVAQDINGNYSPVAVTVSPNHAFITITAFPEGLYDSETDNMVSDTARVYLRSDVSPYAIVESSAALLNSSGTGTFYFSNAVNGANYYIVITHRNSIETWSNTPQAFTGGELTYNFTIAVTQAYGDNMKQVDATPVQFALYSGDVNQDGRIDLTDLIDIYNDLNNAGYVPADLNYDEFVDISDLILAYNNEINMVEVITP